MIWTVLILIFAFVLEVTLIFININERRALENEKKRMPTSGKSFSVGWDDELGKYICNTQIAEQTYITFTLTKNQVNSLINELEVEKGYAERNKLKEKSK